MASNGVLRDESGRVVKGSARLPGAGRKLGSQNKATKAWKEFVCEMSDDPQVQQILRKSFKKRPELILKVAEHAVGKPTERHEVKAELRMIQWPDGEDIAEE